MGESSAGGSGGIIRNSGSIFGGPGRLASAANGATAPPLSIALVLGSASAAGEVAVEPAATTG
ncbi:hypothetical protein ACIA8K_09225 [Catenuloplanes sp. NPDC051500]|uniref:hypothetical protein n=1 Tax=Catenuloplanes sp. NPDC051500 TaxID=3363959 RepID=UPI0037AFE829